MKNAQNRLKKIREVKVLIVDDSAVVQDRLAEMLSEVEGVEVVARASDPVAAVSSLRDLRPHVVILDIRMSGGSGINLLKSIKQDKSPPVVIMLTNYPYPQYRKKCAELGADFFYDKSTDFDKIPEILRQLLEAER
jgi:DNA-binding NarL/FixJ family response regulator